MQAFSEALTTAKKLYYNDKYGANHLHLRVLATHPDFYHRGAAGMQCRWGMDLARQRGQPVTLFASPMGEQLYSYLGFERHGTVIIQVKGEEEKVSLEAMSYLYKEPS
jgi:hypothetical protein